MIILKKITALFGILVMIACLNIFLVGFVSAAPGNLDNDDLADNIDPDTIVSSSATLPAGEYSFRNLTITNNAVLTLNSNTSLSGFKGVKIEALNLIVDAGAAISADGKGYPANQGSGVGQFYILECHRGYGGSSYGGIGGNGYYAPGGPTYGSALNPVDLGSGGRDGEPGGGAIVITVNDTVSLDGKISANGGNFSYDGGTGSGGSININTNRFTGSGIISSNGGNGGYYSSYGCSRTAGSGGGGRIATRYQFSTFNGEIEANSPGNQGGDGTIVLMDKSNNILYTGRSFTFQESESPFIFDHIILSNSKIISGGNISITTDDFSMTNSQVTIDGLSSSINSENLISYNSTVLLKGGSRFSISQPALISDSNISLTGAQQFISIPSLTLNNSTVTLAGAGTLRASELILSNHSLVTTVPLSKIDLQLTNLNVDGSSVISGDEKGFPASQGPGVGQKSNFECNWYFGGSGYGGIGGVGYSAPGGPTYGSALNPIDFGSGGIESQPGGGGGGAILITVSDTVSLDGKISANGGNTPGWGGAGSGGSININTNRFTGSGIISANGGNGGYISGSCSRLSGSGGGGRIATYYQSSSFNGQIEANSPSFYKGGDGTVEVSNPSIDAPISTLSFTEKTRNEKILTEDLLHKNATISNAICEGDLKGTLSISPFEMVKINSGSFIGKGFTKGNWQATLETLPYQGQWRGMFFLKESEKKIYLKGTTSGDISGVVEGYLTESTPGSGIYDHYNATWQINQLGNNQVSATFTVSGLVSYQSDTEYPSTQLYALQTSTQGVTSGHYTGPLDIVLTHVRIADKSSHYNGEGFSIVSYTSDSGSGEGWTYNKEIYQNITELNGLFTKPLLGKVTGRLDETKTPKSLIVLLERLDIGQPPMADLEVQSYAPWRISPGQTWDYIITVRNNGQAVAENVTVIDMLPWQVTYVSGTSDALYRWETHEVIWKLGTLAPKDSRTVTVKVTSMWGIPARTTLKNIVMVGSTSNETDTYVNPDASIPNLDEYIEFKPIAVVSTQYIPPSGFKQEITSHSDLRNLHDLAIEQGFDDTDISGEITMSDGTAILEHIMDSKDQEEIVIIIREQNPAKPENDGSVIVKIDKNSNMTVFTREGGITIDKNGVSVQGTPTPQTCRYADRLRNCMNDALPGIAKDVALTFVSGPIKTVTDIVQTTWDVYRYSYNCIRCQQSESSDDNEYCEGCFSKGAAVIQDMAGAAPFFGDLAYCGARSTDPSFKSCNYCTHTTRCPNAWEGMLYGNAVIPIHCSENCELVDASLAYSSSDSRYRQRIDCGEQVPNGVCKATSSSSAKCVEPVNEAVQNSIVWTGKDPNAKYGQEGRVTAGQQQDYRVEFENVGDGIAYGVYYTDTLDENLDDTSLQIGPVYSTAPDHSLIAPAGTYNPATRTITWMVGEVGSKQGGYANYTINIKDVPDGTEIINYATVYFPSVPEITKTNAILSIVGYNRLPVIDRIDEQVANVTELIKFSVNATDPDGDPLTYEVSLADGSSLPSGAKFDPSTKLFRWTPTLEQVGDYRVRIDVSDWKGKVSRNVSIYVEKEKIPPLPLANFTAIPTTGTAPLFVQFNDTSIGDIASWNWSFGDESDWVNITVAEERNVTHQYSKHGEFESQLIVMNSAGESTAKQTIKVTQKTPEASFDATPKSGIAPLFVQFNDTSVGDMTSWNWSFGDGSDWFNTTVLEERNVTYTYNTQGTYTAKLLVQNSGGESTATVTITVSNPPPENHPPVLDDIGTKNVIAGQPLQFTISAADPDGDVLINTTGELPLGATFDIKTGEFTWTPTTAGTFEVTFIVSDGKLNDSKVVIIIVSAVTQPLTITSLKAKPESINEGSSVELSVTYSDPGTTGAHTISWDFGDGTTGSGESVTHMYKDNNDYEVNVTVTNSAGVTASKSIAVKVNNVAPDLGAIVVPIEPNVITRAIIVNSSLTDPGILDTFTAVWTWDDGTNSSANLPAGSTTIPGTHTYKTPGIYTISLNVTDKDGGKDYAEATSFVVIYDPSGGFVTGGGWINSPIGAYIKNPLLSGKATFGFVSKYEKGKTLPKGNTEFQFHAADINFHSEYYDWLVIAGPKAQYKGNGTINNAGAYGFMLTAIDGNVKDGGGVDKFRIKIWNKTAGDEIVYDNKMGAMDDADPTTAIASGSIVIHK